jgi:hypothetical protein
MGGEFERRGDVSRTLAYILSFTDKIAISLLLIWINFV